MANCSDNINAVVAKNVKKYRTNAGFSQIALPLKLERGEEYILQIERGFRTPTLKSLCKIAEALNVKPYQLLLDEDEMNFAR